MTKKDDKYYIEKGKKAEQFERRFNRAVKGLPILQHTTSKVENTKAVNRKSRYNVLDEAREIANQCLERKPEGINVTDADWTLAKPETRDLLTRVDEFMKPLEDAYWEAVRQREWRRALLLYQKLVGKPYLFSINPVIHSEAECRENESEFISWAKEWVGDVGHLLNQTY